MPEMNELIEKIAEHIEYYINYAIPFLDTPKEFSLNPIINKNISEYIRRFVKYFPIGEEDLINLCIYFDRFLTKKPNHIITEYNIHMIVAVLIVLEQKYHEDDTYKYKYYAEAAGVTPLKLSLCEYQLLTSWFSHNLHISEDEYIEYQKRIANPVLLEKSVLAANPNIHHNFSITADQSILKKKTCFTHMEYEERTELVKIFQAPKNKAFQKILMDYDLNMDQVIANLLQEIEKNISLGLMDTSWLIEVKHDLLVFALETRKKSLTITLLDEGIDPNFNPSNNAPAFWFAIKNDWEDVVDTMLSRDLLPDTLQQTLLLICYNLNTYNRQTYASQIFIKFPSINLNCYKTPTDDYALHLAIKHKASIKFISLLCSMGAKVTLENGAHKSPLMLAVESGQLDTFTTLLNHALSSNSEHKLPDKQVIRMIDLLLITYQSKLAKMLLDSPLVGSKDKLLVLAIKEQSSLAAMWLLKSGAQADCFAFNHRRGNNPREAKDLAQLSLFPSGNTSSNPDPMMGPDSSILQNP